MFKSLEKKMIQKDFFFLNFTVQNKLSNAGFSLQLIKIQRSQELSLLIKYFYYKSWKF